MTYCFLYRRKRAVDQVLKCTLTLNIKSLVHKMQYAHRIFVARYFPCNTSEMEILLFLRCLNALRGVKLLECVEIKVSFLSIFRYLLMRIQLLLILQKFSILISILLSYHLPSESITFMYNVGDKFPVKHHHREQHSV